MTGMFSRSRRVTIAMMACLLLVPCYGKKKPPPAPVIVQDNVVQGCLAVIQIGFEKSERTLSAAIYNGCEKEADVTVVVKFYDKAGNQTDAEAYQKLVQPGKDHFTVMYVWPLPRFSTAWNNTVTGRVASLSGTAL
ncbi:MAG: hypothetical protein ABSH47_07280 [Bryobacteraceae bacterium]|jgi:uncharacterized protein YcfL